MALSGLLDGGITVSWWKYRCSIFLSTIAPNSPPGLSLFFAPNIFFSNQTLFPPCKHFFLPCLCNCLTRYLSTFFSGLKVLKIKSAHSRFFPFSVTDHEDILPCRWIWHTSRICAYAPRGQQVSRLVGTPTILPREDVVTVQRRGRMCAPLSEDSCFCLLRVEEINEASQPPHPVRAHQKR